MGATGWGWEACLPYFRKLETDVDFGDAPYHGNQGPLPVYRAPIEQWGTVDRALREAALGLGYPLVRRPQRARAAPASGPTRSTAGRACASRPTTAISSRRAAAPTSRSSGNAVVDTLHLRGQSPACQRRPRERSAARRATCARAARCILSAGAIHSPAILQRSGIGPRALLDGLGIEVVAERPVGEHLLDHPILGLMLDLQRRCAGQHADASPHQLLPALLLGLAGAGVNDMIMIAGNLRPEEDGGTARARLAVSAFQAFSEGTVRITTRDPAIDPRVDERMLSDESDLYACATACSGCASSACSRPSSAISTPRRVRHDRPLDRRARSSRRRWTTGCSTNAPTPSMPAAPAAWARRTIHASVVDPECRVIGCSGLRVIDASVMPTVVRANTHFTTVMIAEKMADELKQSRPRSGP